ncbi:MAG: GlxA family transcriptional regulator [Verrucomicrobiota bacterium]
MSRPRRDSSRLKPRRIVFLAFPQVVLLDLTGPWEVFSLANSLAASDVPPYRLELVSGDGSESVCAGGITMTSHGTAPNCRGAIDTLIVPAAEMIERRDTLPQASKIVKRLAERARRLVSICAGAFFLAEAGILNGKNATTHWRGSGELARRYPEIDVQADSIYVKDGNTYTSAGVTAGIDLALALVEEDLGRAMALECARQLVVFMRRPGGQSQFSATLESQDVEQNSIRELIAWATDHPSADLSVTALAERAHMSLRNFSRVFRREVGQTPAAFVEKIRVESSRRQLEESDHSLESIASHCGFGSADSMRRSFYRVVKVAPSGYRQRFRR